MYSLCINGNTTQVEEYIGQSKPAKTIETQCLSQESTEEDDEVLYTIHHTHYTDTHTHTYTHTHIHTHTQT